MGLVSLFVLLRALEEVRGGGGGRETLTFHRHQGRKEKDASVHECQRVILSLSGAVCIFLVERTYIYVKCSMERSFPIDLSSDHG